jgi:hypothetical protein
MCHALYSYGHGTLLSFASGPEEKSESAALKRITIAAVLMCCHTACSCSGDAISRPHLLPCGWQ